MLDDEVTEHNLAQLLVAVGCRIQALLSSSPRIVVVGISGMDAAGKSTFAEALFSHLRSESVPTEVVSVDDFLRPRADRYAHPDPGVAYYAFSVDFQRLRDTVLGRAAECLELNLTIPQKDLISDAVYERRLILRAPAVLIIEGVFLLRPELLRYFDLTIWISVDEATILRRATSRPRDLAHYGSEATVREKYLTRLIPGQRLHQEQDQPESAAHLVIDGSKYTVLSDKTVSIEGEHIDGELSE